MINEAQFSRDTQYAVGDILGIIYETQTCLYRRKQQFALSKRYLLNCE